MGICGFIVDGFILGTRTLAAVSSPFMLKAQTDLHAAFFFHKGGFSAEKKNELA